MKSRYSEVSENGMVCYLNPSRSFLLFFKVIRSVTYFSTQFILKKECCFNISPLKKTSSLILLELYRFLLLHWCYIKRKWTQKGYHRDFQFLLSFLDEGGLFFQLPKINCSKVSTWQAITCISRDECFLDFQNRPPMYVPF